MIARIWHGWTTTKNAEPYERLLEEVIFPKIAAKEITGYKKIQLLRRSLDNEIEFITIMWFDSWDAVKEFAGEDYLQAYVPSEAQELLSRFEKQSKHYKIMRSLTY